MVYLVGFLALIAGWVLGQSLGEGMFKRYLQLKADTPGSRSFMIRGKWYMVVKESEYVAEHAGQSTTN